MMEEISGEVGKFGQMSELIKRRADQGRFLVGSAELLNEIEIFLEKESPEDGSNAALQQIHDLASKYMDASIAGLKEISSVVYDFISICSSLQAFGSALEMVRLTGKIEAARLADGAGVNTVLDDLKKFQASLADGIKEILYRNSSMSRSTSTLSQQLNKGV